MGEKRKHLRVALSAGDYEKFLAAKAKAENTAQVIMTDPQYAISLIRWAVRESDA